MENAQLGLKVAAACKPVCDDDFALFYHIPRPKYIAQRDRGPAGQGSEGRDIPLDETFFLR